MKHKGSNHFVGYEIISHEFKMRFKMLGEIFIIGGVVQLIVASIITKIICSADEWQLAWRYVVAKIATTIYLKPSFHIPGIDGVVSSAVLLNSKHVAGVVGGVYAKLIIAVLASFWVWFLYPLVMRIIKSRADKEMTELHLRGMQLIEEADLASTLKQKSKNGLLPFGPKIKLPREYESEHVFIGGKPRVGKSVILKQQIAAIRNANHRACVADFKGEYTELFYRPEKDHILNPVDKRGSNWQVFSEINNKTDLNGFCDSLIPDSTGDDRFWSSAAKAVFRGILAGLYNLGTTTNRDIWAACTMPIKEIAQLCKSTPSGQAGFAYIQDASSKQAAGVIAVMMSYVSWLEFACDCTGPAISTSDFLESEGTFLFLTGRPEVESTIRPMTGLFIDLMCRRILSLGDAEHDMKRKTYMCLDEFGNLQKLPSIIRFATAAGSKGGVMLLAIQDFAAIQKTYGRESAETLFNTCGNTAILNVADPATAEYFSKRFGKREFEYVRKNYKMSSQDQGDGQTLTRDEKESDLIMPSQFQMLPKLKAYIKIPEHNPALISLDIQPINNQKPQAEAFIMRGGLDLDYIVETQLIITEAADSWKNKKPSAVESDADLLPTATSSEQATATPVPNNSKVDQEIDDSLTTF